MIYGANLRVPLTVHKEVSMKMREDLQNTTTDELRINLRDKRLTSGGKVKEAIKDAGNETTYYTKIKARNIDLSPNVRILLLLPEKSNRLAVLWQRPFVISRKISDVNHEEGKEITELENLEIIMRWMRWSLILQDYLFEV